MQARLAEPGRRMPSGTPSSASSLPFRHIQAVGEGRKRLRFATIRIRQQREDLMKYPLTTVFVTAAFALPLAAAAQERYPALNPDQLSAEQKAYVENLQKPPRNNTTALKNPPFKVYMRSPELANKLQADSDYASWRNRLPTRLPPLPP